MRSNLPSECSKCTWKCCTLPAIPKVARCSLNPEAICQHCKIQMKKSESDRSMSPQQDRIAPCKHSQISSPGWACKQACTDPLSSHMHIHGSQNCCPKIMRVVAPLCTDVCLAGPATGRLPRTYCVTQHCCSAHNASPGGHLDQLRMHCRPSCLMHPVHASCATSAPNVQPD